MTPEPLPDCWARDAELAGDIRYRRPGRNESNRLRAIPSMGSVQPAVFVDRQELKVLQPVVGSIFVDVMNMLMALKLSANSLFKQVSMFRHLFPINCDQSVSFAV